ncbi:MAG: di-heme oxidoredictase family protein [Vicinamibacterales bacterium]
MTHTRRFWQLVISTALFACALAGTATTQETAIGREVAVPRHLQDGEEYGVSMRALLEHGRRLFVANWTVQEGGGRPLVKGTGATLSDGHAPLVFPRNFNRVSAPDANSCAGCHNAPFGLPGGGGDIVANVFVLGQRFDFATFDGNDRMPTGGGVDELGVPVSLQTVANSRNTLGMFGSGFVEMLARQMTRDLQAARDATPPGGATPLRSKGIAFGTIRRGADGAWNTSEVVGLPAPSLRTTGPTDPPNLVVRPFHQAGNVISLRQFTNNAFNHHHGIQPTERWGQNTDPDGDGFANELTRADVTAVTLFQATMAVPGRVIPNDPDVEAAIATGERRFHEIGCTSCHVPSLPLDDDGWVFTEPNPFNPVGNLRPGEARAVAVDLTRNDLPSPRLDVRRGRVDVPAYTDLKLHDITSGPDDPNREPLDMNQPAGSAGFFAGNSRFLTRKLWGAANEPPYFHHGLYTTMRQAVHAHAGEALASRQAFEALAPRDRDALIEFLKTLQVLPPGTPSLIVDEHYRPKRWPSRDR